MPIESKDERLSRLLEDVADGLIQLPDFQREWVWDDERIRKLLASISLAYPVGAVMMLQVDSDSEAGKDSIQFKQRPLVGVSASTGKAKQLILDGQQRLTSLFQALLLDRPTITQNQPGKRAKEIKRWYYINMQKALGESAEREDAIFSVPENRIQKSRNEIQDYSEPKYEYANMVFPLKNIFNPNEWTRGFYEHWDAMEKVKFWQDFDEKVIKNFREYEIPVIKMGRKTPKDAVCQVFEHVNTGGVPLDVFDLLTATFAADGFELRKDWGKREQQLREYRVLRDAKTERSIVSSTQFLQAVTLLATQERRGAISCKRAGMLRLTRDEYERCADRLMNGFEKAVFFLRSQRVFESKWLPYPTQLIPLAAILTVLNKDLNESENNKLAQWYWCGVFGELYSRSLETRFARDFPEVVEWMRGGEIIPQTVAEAWSSAPRLKNRIPSLQRRTSALYKGVYSLILWANARDWITGARMEDYFGMQVDIHHIFPQKWCKDQSIESERADSIVNKTPLSTRTNQKIGGRAPSEYLTRIEADQNSETNLNGHLESHCIDPALLRSDDFDGFFEERLDMLIDQIGKAMGTKIVMDIDFPDEDEEGEEPPADYEMIDEESQTIIDEDE